MSEAVLFEPTKVKTVRALHDHIIVCDMSFDQKLTNGGIILLGDDKKLEGIHPRWAKVYSVGPEQKDIQVGQWVCVAHGRWTRGLEVEDAQGERVIRRIDPKDILLVSNTPMVDETIGDNMGIVNKNLY